MLFTQEVAFSGASPDGRSLAVLRPPADAPAPFRLGQWQVGWTEYKGGGLNERVGCAWTGVSGSIRVRSAHFEVTDRISKKVIWSTTLEDVDFPPTAEGCIQSPLVHSTGAFLCFALRLELQEDISCEAVKPSELAQRFAAFAAGQAPNNVLLYFPRSRRQLWTTEQTLQQSPYFASLLSSDFAEASVTSATTVDADSVEPLPYDDSDDEAKLPLDSKRSPPRLPPAVAPHKTVNITEASYSTYLAVICWMQSGHITFAPLTSSSAPLGASSGAAAQASSKQGPPPTPSSSLVPVSPRLVYRLSHLLELSALTALALANYTSQLRISNAAYELFSETSSLYDPLFDAACKVVVENAKEVFETKGMREAEGRMEEGTMGEGTMGEGTMGEWEGRAWGRLARKLGRKV